MSHNNSIDEVAVLLKCEPGDVVYEVAALLLKIENLKAELEKLVEEM